MGDFSKPSKMPWLAWSTPAKDCKNGSKLHDVPGSVCEGCYALRGFYNMGTTRRAMARRQAAWKEPGWTGRMIDDLYEESQKVAPSLRFFRWFDSGDIQSVAQLHKIVLIAEALPGIGFYLPTKEYGIVRQYLKRNEVYGFPRNLVVRPSAPMVDEDMVPIPGLTRSKVESDPDMNSPDTCPAKLQANKCWDCRMCWDPEQELIIYPHH